MSGNEFKEKIKIAREASEEFEEPYKSIAFREILNRLLYEKTSKEVAEPKIVGDEVITPTKTPPMKTLGEFFNEKTPKSHPDTIMTFAYYFYKHKNKIFNVKDIEECYSKVLKPKPKNPSDMINVNRRKGYIMIADEKKDERMGFLITREGIKYVENNFEKLK